MTGWGGTCSRQPQQPSLSGDTHWASLLALNKTQFWPPSPSGALSPSFQTLGSFSTSDPMGSSFHTCEPPSQSQLALLGSQRACDTQLVTLLLWAAPPLPHALLTQIKAKCFQLLSPVSTSCQTHPVPSLQLHCAVLPPQGLCLEISFRHSHGSSLTPSGLCPMATSSRMPSLLHLPSQHLSSWMH